MPMADVYSALAKGVIDGVVAPADTMKSLHFAEVARDFTPIRFSRGAYPARAMSDRAWRRLPPDLQALLARSRTIWEHALDTEFVKAEAAGIDFGRAQGVRFQPFPADQQAAFEPPLQSRRGAPGGCAAHDRARRAPRAGRRPIPHSRRRRARADRLPHGRLITRRPS